MAALAHELRGLVGPFHGRISGLAVAYGGNETPRRGGSGRLSAVAPPGCGRMKNLAGLWRMAAGKSTQLSHLRVTCVRERLQTGSAFSNSALDALLGVPPTVYSLLIAAAAIALMLSGTALGVYLNRRLPDEHLTERTMDIVKLATGIVATIAGLVLSLLITSAKNSYDSVAMDVKGAAADFIMLDRTLEQFGERAVNVRTIIRQAIEKAAKTDLDVRTTNKDRIGDVVHLHEAAQREIRTMAMLNPGDEILRDRALSLAYDLSKARWMLQQEANDTLPTAFQLIVMLWLALIFGSFGLFTPPNPIALGALVVGAISVSASLFLINELSTPFYGIVRISTAPLWDALNIIGPLR